MPITKYVGSWFSSAEDDLKSVRAMLKEGLANPACFHCQQSAEKYFKGFLAFHEKHVRKVHDLPTLLNLCNEIDGSLETLLSDAEYLTNFYVESRYADDYPRFTLNEAERAYKAAMRVKDFISQKVRKNPN